MLVIGLTGGIGSGKSTVARLFAEHGVPLLDADVIARELTDTKQAAWHEIQKHFGSSILKEDGSLDRGKLRDIIFNDAKQRLWLEELLHPMIRQEIADRLKNLNSPYCLVIIPLLVESGPYPFLNRILVVDASLDSQIARLQTRDQAHPDDLHKIIRTQASPEKRLALADDVIVNDGKLEDLKMQVDKLHKMYLGMKASD